MPDRLGGTRRCRCCCCSSRWPARRWRSADPPPTGDLLEVLSLTQGLSRWRRRSSCCRGRSWSTLCKRVIASGAPCCRPSAAPRCATRCGRTATTTCAATTRAPPRPLPLSPSPLPVDLDPRPSLRGASDPLASAAARPGSARSLTGRRRTAAAASARWATTGTRRRAGSTPACRSSGAAARFSDHSSGSCVRPPFAPPLPLLLTRPALQVTRRCGASRASCLARAR